MYAVSAAGVVHAITRACSKGELQHCACDPTKRGTSSDHRGEFDWGGCSDNVRYGSHFSRMFVDAKERKVRDAKALMNLHNNRAGRRVSGDTSVTCSYTFLGRDVGQWYKSPIVFVCFAFVFNKN